MLIVHSAADRHSQLSATAIIYRADHIITTNCLAVSYMSSCFFLYF